MSPSRVQALKIAFFRYSCDGRLRGLPFLIPLHAFIEEIRQLIEEIRLFSETKTNQTNKSLPSRHRFERGRACYWGVAVGQWRNGQC